VGSMASVIAELRRLEDVLVRGLSTGVDEPRLGPRVGPRDAPNVSLGNSIMFTVDWYRVHQDWSEPRLA